MISVDALTFKFYSEQSTGLSCERCTCVGTYNQNVHIYDALTLQYVLQLTGHVGIINSIIVSPSGRFMFSSSSDSTIMVSIASFHIESTLCNNLWLLGFCVYEQDNWKKTVDRFRWNFLVGWVLGLEKLDYLLGVFQLPVIVQIVYLDWSGHWVRVLVVCCVFFHQILQMVLGARKIRYSFGSNLESGRPWT